MGAKKRDFAETPFGMGDHPRERLQVLAEECAVLAEALGAKDDLHREAGMLDRIARRAFDAVDDLEKWEEPAPVDPSPLGDILSAMGEQNLKLDALGKELDRRDIKLAVFAVGSLLAAVRDGYVDTEELGEMTARIMKWEVEAIDAEEAVSGLEARA